MHIAGIDPGMSGGWAILSIGEGLPMLFNGGRMPVLKQGSKTLVDAVALWDGLASAALDCVVVETVHAMPRQGCRRPSRSGRLTGRPTPWPSCRPSAWRG